ncbi:hypothetical protein PAT3040_06651 [Paenibacillus agaridevorans]|uniref:Uncharacterized protein n=1 Tax=Paenibacillus agaridevorans TaxID=171404 RepID=A0A2R5F620_9BACL|nr:hypothetical protein PAT3040_06651 [Paenibacillus agaridevorans]
MNNASSNAGEQRINQCRGQRIKHAANNTKPPRELTHGGFIVRAYRPGTGVPGKAGVIYWLNKPIHSK